MLFTAQPDVIWFDIVMSNHFKHSLRRHLMKLHPRNHDMIVVRSALQVSFLHCEDDLHIKWTEEYARRNSHELMHYVAKNGACVIPAITNVTAALSVRLVLSSSHASSCIAADLVRGFVRTARKVRSDHVTINHVYYRSWYVRTCSIMFSGVCWGGQSRKVTVRSNGKFLAKCTVSNCGGCRPTQDVRLR